MKQQWQKWGIGIMALVLLMKPLCAADRKKEEGRTGEVREKSLLDIYRAGGFWMHPILLCSIGSIAAASYCLLRIRRSVMLPERLTVELYEMTRTGQLTEAARRARGDGGSLGVTVYAMLRKVGFPRQEVETAAAEALVAEENRMMHWVNYLNVFAQTAPMLGLLGTVVGMIQSFSQLSSGLSDPSELAGGIGVAMTTTAGGLIVAIPSMFLFFYFRGQLQSCVGEIQKSVESLVDVMFGVESAAGEGG